MNENRKWWQTVPWNERTRGQKIAIIAGWIALLGILSIGISEQPEDERKQIDDIKSTEVVPHSNVTGEKGGVDSEKNASATSPADADKNAGVSKPQKSLGMTPEEFRRSFNSIVRQINTDWELAKFDIEKGEVNDIFGRMLSNNIGIIGSVNKADGSLREIMVMISGGAESSENMKAIAVLLAVSQSINRNTPKEENSKIISDMVRFAANNIKTGKSVERITGGLRYTASASEFTGLMFVISKP